MSRFLDLLRKENERNSEDLYGDGDEERLAAQQQYIDLWKLLADEPGDVDDLIQYIESWTKKLKRIRGEDLQFDSIVQVTEKTASAPKVNLLFDSVGPDGLKPLHWCCMKGFGLEVIEILLDNGTDIDDTHGSAAGETPLLLSVNYAHTNITRLLISRGARTDLLDKFGNSPLSVVDKKLKSKNGTIRDMYTPIATLLTGAFVNDVDRANSLRQDGNSFFRMGEYKRAIALYTDSIRYAEDARTFSNRSQCYIEIARRGRGEPRMELEYLRKIYRQALQDANMSRVMAPEDTKGYFRTALASIGCGDFPSAVRVLHNGLTKCSPHSKSTASVSCTAAALGQDVVVGPPMCGVTALHFLLEVLTLADVPLGEAPLEPLRPKSALLVHHSPRSLRHGRGQDSQEQMASNDMSAGAEYAAGKLLSCSWCEMPLPYPTADISVNEKCPCCGCRLCDFMTPLRVRRQYLGPCPREDALLGNIEQDTTRRSAAGDICGVVDRIGTGDEVPPLRDS